jgi:hypothetical protein
MRLTPELSRAANRIFLPSSCKVIQTLPQNLTYEELSPRRLVPRFARTASLFRPNLLTCVRMCGTPDILPSKSSLAHPNVGDAAPRLPIIQDDNKPALNGRASALFQGFRTVAFTAFRMLSWETFEVVAMVRTSIFC